MQCHWFLLITWKTHRLLAWVRIWMLISNYYCYVSFYFAKWCYMLSFLFAIHSFWKCVMQHWVLKIHSHGCMYFWCIAAVGCMVLQVLSKHLLIALCLPLDLCHAQPPWDEQLVYTLWWLWLELLGTAGSQGANSQTQTVADHLLLHGLIGLVHTSNILLYFITLVFPCSHGYPSTLFAFLILINLIWNFPFLQIAAFI